jgi:DNA-binding Lrp family transcriptional regulator
VATVFVLINSEIGAEEEVLAALRLIEEVKEAYMVYGVYDIIAKIVAPSMDTIKTTILNQIRGVADVRSTLTMIAVLNNT